MREKGRSVGDNICSHKNHETHSILPSVVHFLWLALGFLGLYRIFPAEPMVFEQSQNVAFLCLASFGLGFCDIIVL